MNTEKKTPQQRQQDYAGQIAAELIGMIRAGTAPWQRPWQPTQDNDLPFNHTTGKAYGGSNILTLMMRPYTDPRWMTYKQAQSVGAQVRKGERGTTLFKLVTHSEQVKKDRHGQVVKDAEGHPVKERIALEQPYLSSFSVFNAQQIEGLPEWQQQPVSALWAEDNIAETLLAASGAVIEHQAGNRAYYSPGQDKIVLPHQHQFASQGDYYAVALHELGHWSGHESRLSRDLSGRFGSAEYAKEELRAEIASMMLTRQLGLAHKPERHAAYVESWVSVLQDDPMEILRASRDAQKIQHYILSFRSQTVALNPTGQMPTPDTPTTEPDHAAQRLARAKEHYYSQNYLLSTGERQQRAVLEYGMEKLTAAMPPALKAEAQANFYENQLRQTAQRMDVPQMAIPEMFRQPEQAAPAGAAAATGNLPEPEPDR